MLDLPTTTATIEYQTLKAAGGDYTKLSDFELQNRDLVSENKALVLTCDNLLNPDAGVVNFDGWTTDTTHYIYIRAADPHLSKGTLTSNSFRMMPTTAGQTTLQTQTIGASGCMYFEGIQFFNDTSATSCISPASTDSPVDGAKLVFKNCVLSMDKSGAMVFYYSSGTDRPNIELENTIAISQQGHVIHNSAGGGAFIKGRNSTLISLGGYALYTGATIANDLLNCYLHGSAGSLFNESGSTIDHCATSDADGDIPSIAYNDVTFKDTTQRAEDLTTGELSSLIDAGADISGEDYTTDIAGIERNIATPTVGASEWVLTGQQDITNAPLGIFMAEPSSTTVPSGMLGVMVYGGPHDVPDVYLGANVFGAALADANKQGYLGIQIYSEGNSVPNASLGLYADALPLTTVPNAKLGALASGLFQPTDAKLGLFMWGHPAKDYHTETQGRLLITANSDNAIDQSMLIDAVTIFKGLGTADFNAQWIAKRRAIAEFYAKLKIVRYINPPTIEITEVNYKLADGETYASGVPIDNFYEGARRIEVKVSGWLGDADTWSHAQIDFGEPWRGDAATIHSSISGFTTDPVWTADHVYSTSGNYFITARAVDNYGSVASDIRELNLASGLVPGIDYPALSISATPRLGDVPPELEVAFTTTPSGSFSIGYPTDDNIFWNLGNRETSKRKNPITHYSSPGLYTPICRYRYQTASGNYIWLADTLRIGYNY